MSTLNALPHSKCKTNINHHQANKPIRILKSQTKTSTLTIDSKVEDTCASNDASCN